MLLQSIECNSKIEGNGKRRSNLSAVHAAYCVAAPCSTVNVEVAVTEIVVVGLSVTIIKIALKHQFQSLEHKRN